MESKSKTAKKQIDYINPGVDICLDKHYQIFISSTFIDLKQERKAVFEAILNAKHIPAGMESFSASNDEQFKYIRKIIDNCDYYVLIIANRYGSINPNTGKSYTEQEYEYALEKNIPVLVFLRNATDDDNFDNKEALEKFREKVSRNRLCKFWNNQSDLVSSVIISLMEEMSDNPQPGWVRGGIFDNTELLEQINKIRIKYEKLEKTNELLTKEIIELQSIKEELSQGDDLFEVTGYKTTYSGTTGYSRRSQSHAVSRQLSWNQIFALIGPFLFTYIHYIKFKQELATAIRKHFESNSILCH